MSSQCDWQVSRSISLREREKEKERERERGSEHKDKLTVVMRGRSFTAAGAGQGRRGGTDGIVLPPTCVRLPSKRVSNPFRRQEESVQSESSRTAPSEEHTEHGTRMFTCGISGLRTFGESTYGQLTYSQLDLILWAQPAHFNIQLMPNK